MELDRNRIVELLDIRYISILLSNTVEIWTDRNRIVSAPDIRYNSILLLKPVETGPNRKVHLPDIRSCPTFKLSAKKSIVISVRQANIDSSNQLPAVKLFIERKENQLKSGLTLILMGEGVNLAIIFLMSTSLNLFF
mgnify:CR=1 FL=1